MEAFKQGADPLLLYVDAVPYQSPAADEDGLLGTFAEDQVAMLDPAFDGAGELRLLRLAPEALRPAVRDHGPAGGAGRDRPFPRALRGRRRLRASPPPAEAPPGEMSLLDIAITLLDNTTT